ncbi:outer membrane assembly complex, YaeT protein [Ehrlichia chaffeensis str. Heartland]|uniref:Outer membrane protein assembly factor BamA n=1 Tax=Ehrlichia chaffeensis (strain ATCC CRL-10679 / Arkansas) TaxID=205920 RepID=Q2GFC7_EHRCR|nr:outer membrane protein assembly factor BamA [Ehrlichia chaffeensis]ABD45160.1 outer membrane protein, OMP85 family [Ehrlichia chaffeensis str. Arkansas]AHX03278.1 outer membrane assembly complex, YaeT protein [Ehrlichia chaffeensis str. Heartland]AHX06184.1 outer membrane assembly complex, YaeT protein [Ehrlichia chaffeensis str. Liberty]AHX07476.1 outer membrane assembly complex, YaeT protein [Ehrlichia chaffeensis str. Osceola]AHX08362.1 outer membrane assembly complex, YaeT protein [Ehrl
MRYIIIILILFTSSLAHAEALNTKIKQVQINGNHRLDYKTIYFYSKINLQDNVTQETIDQIIKNLHSTQLFSHIEVYVNQDNYLVINVTENPVINNIVFYGNKEFSKKDLVNDILKLKKLAVFTKSKLQQDISNLLSLYQSKGKLSAKVTYEVKELENNKIDIIIKINEGPTSRIKIIKFTGNQFFSDAMLKKAIQSSEYYPYKIFSSNTKFASERLMLDQAGLYNFYTSKGFIDFKIKSVVPEIREDHNINLIFAVEEGIRYKFGNSNIIIDKQVSNHQQLKEEIQNLILSKSGDTFNRESINNSIEKITQYLSNNGNFFSDIKHEYRVKDDVVDIDYIIYTGNKVYINNISITNNKTTLDQVIRRKLTISEGDIYNASVINRSYKNILGLGFFESVNVENHKINDSLVDLNFQVKERGTGTFSVSAGFSSVTGLVGKINIQERNLFGTGKILSLQAEKSTSSLSSSIDFVVPNFSETDSAVGFGLFYSHQNKPKGKDFPNLINPAAITGNTDAAFSSSNAGFMLHTSHDITDDLNLALHYAYKHVNIFNVKDTASELIKEQAGKNIDSSVGYSLQFRKFDNLSKIKDGYLVKLHQSFSGLGGTLHYIKTEGSVNYSREILPKVSSDILLNIKTSMGYVFSYKSDEQVKINQRFIIGSNEIRGFHVSGIGPRDKKTLDALGGKFYFNMINQVDFPIGLPDDLGIKGSLFVDAATLFGLDYINKEYYEDKSLRVSVGFGISWRSPFGPMRLDFGFPILKKDYDVTDMIRFSMQ